MSIEQRIKYHKYLLVSKCLKNEAPIYLKNKIQYLSDRNPYSLRNVVSEKLQIPKAKIELFKKTFTYSGPYCVLYKLQCMSKYVNEGLRED